MALDGSAICRPSVIIELDIHVYANLCKYYKSLKIQIYILSINFKKSLKHLFSQN